MVLTDSVSRQSDDIRKITTDTARIPILQNEQNIPSQMQPHRDTRKKQTPIFSGGLSLIQAQGKKRLKWKEDKAHKDFGLCEQLPTCVRPQKTATKVPGVWMIRSRWQHNLHNELKAGMV